MTTAAPPAAAPKVEFLELDLARWTFDTDDREQQESQFRYWRGYFGFEESDWPHEMDGAIWLVRRGGQRLPS